MIGRRPRPTARAVRDWLACLTVWAAVLAVASLDLTPRPEPSAVTVEHLEPVMTQPALSCPNCGCPVPGPSSAAAPPAPEPGPTSPLKPLPPLSEVLGPNAVVPRFAELCLADAATGRWCELHAQPLMTCDALRPSIDQGGR